jgi:hypothetical protein
MHPSDLADPAKTELHADILQSNTQRAVNFILDARREMDKQGKYDKPLTVYSGNNYSGPADRVFDLIVMEELARREELGVAFARPHNSALRMLGIAAHDPRAPLVQQADLRGTVSLLAVLAGHREWTPYTSPLVAQRTLELDLPACFTDAARLDPQEQVFPKRSAQHIANCTSKFAQAAGVRINYQMAGRNLVAGSCEDGFKDADSLLANSLRQGDTAVGIKSAGESAIFDYTDNAPFGSKLLALPSLPHVTAHAGTLMPLASFGGQRIYGLFNVAGSTLVGEPQEADYTNRLLAACGRKPGPESLSEVAAESRTILGWIADNLHNNNAMPEHWPQNERLIRQTLSR